MQDMRSASWWPSAGGRPVPRMTSCLTRNGRIEAVRRAASSTLREDHLRDPIDGSLVLAASCPKFVMSVLVAQTKKMFEYTALERHMGRNVVRVLRHFRRHDYDVVNRLGSSRISGNFG